MFKYKRMKLTCQCGFIRKCIHTIKEIKKKKKRLVYDLENSIQIVQALDFKRVLDDLVFLSLLKHIPESITYVEYLWLSI